MINTISISKKLKEELLQRPGMKLELYLQLKSMYKIRVPQAGE